VNVQDAAATVSVSVPDPDVVTGTVFAHWTSPAAVISNSAPPLVVDSLKAFAVNPDASTK
jgi:phosphatidylethanolamine-binding protein (PEBP) family uncharacterized protein